MIKRHTFPRNLHRISFSFWIDFGNLATGYRATMQISHILLANMIRTPQLSPFSMFFSFQSDFYHKKPQNNPNISIGEVFRPLKKSVNFCCKMCLCTHKLLRLWTKTVLPFAKGEKTANY